MSRNRYCATFKKPCFALFCEGEGGVFFLCPSFRYYIPPYIHGKFSKLT